jgi:hypothetical protein
MRWVWKVTTDAPHTVVAEIGLTTPRETIWVDGRVVSDQNSMKFRSENLLPLGEGVEGKVLVSTAWYGAPRCRLLVDGREIPPSQGEKGDVHLPDQVAGQAKAPPLPPWAWAFVVLCGAIPLVTLGGAIPAAIGFGAAAGCSGAARFKSWSTATRVGICLAITVAAWAGLLAVLGMLHAGRRR